jgi:Fe2+ or Zn2+ uptake regulation protein
LAQALLTITDQRQPPLRFLAGADAVATAEQVISTLQQQTAAFRDLSTSLGFDAVGR